MILKKLRENRKWSQEQLAKMAGLSVRTIQRVESGHKASIESLKSLASVLEVNISTLEQEITVIDKTTEKWKELPTWVRWSFWGSNMPNSGYSNRKDMIRAEAICVISGVLTCLFGFIDYKFLLGGALMLLWAYGLSLYTRLGDKYEIW